MATTSAGRGEGCCPLHMMAINLSIYPVTPASPSTHLRTRVGVHNRLWAANRPETQHPSIVRPCQTATAMAHSTCQLI